MVVRVARRDVGQLCQVVQSSIGHHSCSGNFVLSPLQQASICMCLSMSHVHRCYRVLHIQAEAQMLPMQSRVDVHSSRQGRQWALYTQRTRLVGWKGNLPHSESTSHRKCIRRALAVERLQPTMLMTCCRAASCGENTESLSPVQVNQVVRPIREASSRWQALQASGSLLMLYSRKANLPEWSPSRQLQ